MTWSWLLWDALAAGMGVLAALGDLIAKFRRDDVMRVALNTPGIAFVLLNVAMGVIGFEIAAHTAGLAATDDWIKILGAAVMGGIGGAVVIRSKFFTIRVGNEERSIGPGNIIDGLLGASERHIDRDRAVARARLVRDVMAAVDADKVYHFVSVQVTGALQRLSEADQVEFGRRVGEILSNKGKVPDQDRAFALGYVILDFAGEEFLRDLFHKSP